MPQIFSSSMNVVSRLTVVGGLLLVIVAILSLGALYRSPYVTQVGVPKLQPVPFSHKHHVAGMGIDCRYCHTSVEDGPFAGIPPIETCMTCHSQIWADSPMLAPVRESWETSRPLKWVRVNDLPDFVYFDHSVHINKGVGCVTCHGRVDQMPLTWKVQTFHMAWCLECHRAPEKFLRPKEWVLDMAWEPDEKQEELGNRLVEDYAIQVEQLTDCSLCHR